MKLCLTSACKSLLADLDILYNYYLNVKDEYIQVVDGKSIDIILVETCTYLHEVPFTSLNKVYIKKSNIEGLGVFAKHNIKCGEILTLYPSDIVRVPNKGNLYYEFTSERNLVFKEKYAYQTDYCIIAGDSTCIDDMNLVGHIVNDSCANSCHYDTSNNNCIYYPYHMFVFIVASKNINKDEELLVSYGVDYWKIIKK
jgi:SET domain-containing protein